MNQSDFLKIKFLYRLMVKVEDFEIQRDLNHKNKIDTLIFLNKSIF